MSPKSNKCLYKKEKRRDTERGEVKVSAEIGVNLYKSTIAKDCQQSPETRRKA